MASTSAKMLLRLWDQLSDLYSHDLLAKNLRKIDAHDHTPDRGNQIPTAGIADGAITIEKLAPGVGDATWKKIKTGDFQSASMGPGTFTMGDDINYGVTYDGIFYFDPTDWGLVAGQEDKMKITSILSIFSTAPGVTYSHGLHPVNVSAGAGSLEYGVRVGGANVFSPPHSVNTFRIASVSIPVPAAGLYTLAVNMDAYNDAGGGYNMARLLVRR